MTTYIPIAALILILAAGWTVAAWVEPALRPLWSFLGMGDDEGRWSE